MKILTVSGSVKSQSTNVRLLEAMAVHFVAYEFERYPLDQVPVFHPNKDINPLPEGVEAWRSAIASAEVVWISTPEYIHNIPAVLKNALEWIASSGELVGKPVIAMSYAPLLPRGEKANQSLCWSLQALDAKLIAAITMDHKMITVSNTGQLIGDEGIAMLTEALGMCKTQE